MLPHEAKVFDVVALTVLMSVFLHGMTAAPATRLYGEQMSDPDACPVENETVASHPLRR